MYTYLSSKPTEEISIANRWIVSLLLCDIWTHSKYPHNLKMLHSIKLLVYYKSISFLYFLTVLLTIFAKLIPVWRSCAICFWWLHEFASSSVSIRFRLNVCHLTPFPTTRAEFKIYIDAVSKRIKLWISWSLFVCEVSSITTNVHCMLNCWIKAIVFEYWRI